VSDSLIHPTPDRLEAFVEGGLPDGDRAVLESHVLACVRCQAEVEEWRALFAALSDLPRVAPSVGFAERVMAGVTVAVPWYARAGALLGRLLPKSTFGWTLVVAVLGLPMLTGAGMMAWLLSHPTMTFGDLSYFMAAQLIALLQTGAAGAAALLVENATTLRIVDAARGLLGGAGLKQLGLAASLFSTLTMVSLWVLYSNLVRTTTRERSYVSFSF
jgi:anti-sigma factor RsiW